MSYLKKKLFGIYIEFIISLRYFFIFGFKWSFWVIFLIIWNLHWIYYKSTFLVKAGEGKEGEKTALCCISRAGWGKRHMCEFNFMAISICRNIWNIFKQIGYWRSYSILKHLETSVYIWKHLQSSAVHIHLWCLL